MTRTAADLRMTVVERRATVARPIDQVWARIGGFGDLGRFLPVDCALVAGDGGLGSVRRVGDAVIEPLVGLSHHGYTYSQAAGPMSAHHYHGCVRCEALDAARTLIVYALVYDEGGIDPARRAAERARLGDRFAGVVAAMRAASLGDPVCE